MKTKRISPQCFSKSLPATSMIILLSAVFTIFLQGCNPECDDCPGPADRAGLYPRITAFNVEQGGQIISQTDNSADITIFQNDQLRVSYNIDIPNGFFRMIVNSQFETTGISLSNQNMTASIQLEYYDIHTGVPLVFTVSDTAYRTTSFTINPHVEPGINPLDVVAASWQNTNFDNSSGAYVEPLSIAADNSLIGVSNNILYKSMNGGNTWEKVATPEFLGGINSMVLHPSGELYAVGNFNHPKIIRSTDNGDSWSILNTNLPGYASLKGLQVSKEGSLFLLVSDVSADMQSGIWKSTDGIIWSLQSNVKINNDLWIDSFSVVNDSITLAIGIVGWDMDDSEVFEYLVRSIDYGRTWQLISGETPASGNFLSASDGKIYVASSEIFVSDNLGETWQTLRSGIPNGITINAMTEGPDGKIYIAPQDYGVFRLEGDRWKSVGTDLTAFNVLNLVAVSENLYAYTQPSSIFKLD